MSILPSLDSPPPLEAAPGAAAGERTRSKISFETLLQRKQAATPITALTAYDYPTARLLDEGGIDLILVGDTLGMVVLGYESTLPVTMEDMLHHTRAVRRGVRHALLVADMPFGSYEADPLDGVRNAVRLVKEAGAEAVKIEGGHPRRAELIGRLREAEVPVVAHLGLTPQAVHRMGGYRVQGRTLGAAETLLAEARAVEAAGASAVVRVTASLRVPTIGIGAGPGCDGQILVFHDLVGLSAQAPAKFVRRFGDAGTLMREAVAGYAGQVRSRTFPSDSESYHLDAETRSAFEASAAAGRTSGQD